jgi:hypothetical protein
VITGLREKAAGALHKPIGVTGRSAREEAAKEEAADEAEEGERREDATGVVAPSYRSSIRTKGRLLRRCLICATLSNSLTLP